MEIPNSQACMLPLLKFAADGHQHSLQETTDALAEHFQLPQERQMQVRESGVNILYNTVGWARSFLKQAGLLIYPTRGMLQITEEGKKVLESSVQHIDFKYLERYPSFVEFQNRKSTKTVSDTSLQPDSETELSEHPLISGSSMPEEKQIWVFAPGPQARFWDECRTGSIAVFGTDLLGSLDAYGSKDDILQRLKVVYSNDTEPTNDALAAWEFSHVMKKGDFVIAKKGNHKIVGFGIVSGPYHHDPSRPKYHNIREVEWINEGEWLLPEGVRFATKTLTNITRYPDFVDKILEVIGIDIETIWGKALIGNVDISVTTYEPDIQPEYTITDCSHETGLDEETLKRWLRAIERKGQAILYGPPGTGKTFVAQHLAKHLVADNDGFSELVQFHPTYAYEDFIQGIRPMAGEDGGLSYPLVPGRFLEFCKKAGQRKGPCVLILDEINRANLSRVFGELMYLLEYRDHSIPLAGGERFGIPENVRLIGTMNTADRSIALVDHALRRRFAFLELYPNYEVLERFHSNNGFPVTGLVATLKSVNRQIDDRHYMVGISFFLRNDLEDQIEDIWRMEIEPYLEEYFFDQPAKVEEFRWVKVKGTVAGA